MNAVADPRLRARCPACGGPVTDEILVVGLHSPSCIHATWEWSEEAVSQYARASTVPAHLSALSDCGWIATTPRNKAEERSEPQPLSEVPMVPSLRHRLRSTLRWNNATKCLVAACAVSLWALPAWWAFSSGTFYLWCFLLLLVYVVTIIEWRDRAEEAQLVQNDKQAWERRLSHAVGQALSHPGDLRALKRMLSDWEAEQDKAPRC